MRTGEICCTSITNFKSECTLKNKEIQTAYLTTTLVIFYLINHFRQNHSKKKNGKTFGSVSVKRRTKVSLVKNAECILWDAPVEGRRLLDPLDPLFDNSNEDEILCMKTMKNLTRPSANSSNSDVHDIMFAHRSR